MLFTFVELSKLRNCLESKKCDVAWLPSMKQVTWKRKASAKTDARVPRFHEEMLTKRKKHRSVISKMGLNEHGIKSHLISIYLFTFIYRIVFVYLRCSCTCFHQKTVNLEDCKQNLLICMF